MESTFRQATTGPKGTTVNPVLIAAVATLVIAALVVTLIARMTGYDASAIAESPIIESRQLGFRDLPGGVVEVFDWQDGTVLRTVGTGEGSFLRGVVRSLVRQRRGLATDTMTPFVLSKHADGRLVIADSETGESIDLVAFGPTNVGSFATLLAPQDESTVRAPAID